MVSAQQLGAELRSFDGRRKTVQAMRRALTREVGPTRAAVKASALATLPGSNGLNVWVSKARVTVKISYASRSAGIRLTGSRKSRADKSDLTRIDAGAVRHPSWGRRGPGQWHTQAVTPGWWSDPMDAADGFRAAVDEEVDRALNEIRG